MFRSIKYQLSANPNVQVAAILIEIPDIERARAYHPLISFDFILNTVAAPHNLDAYTSLLKRDGTMTLVGAPATPHASPEVFNLIMKRRSIAGSMIGGIPETQEMLDFCAKHGIVADIELIRADQINDAYTRMLKGDVHYRFVIDTATLTA